MTTINEFLEWLKDEQKNTHVWYGENELAIFKYVENKAKSLLDESIEPCATSSENELERITALLEREYKLECKFLGAKDKDEIEAGWQAYKLTHNIKQSNV